MVEEDETPHPTEDMIVPPVIQGPRALWYLVCAEAIFGVLAWLQRDSVVALVALAAAGIMAVLVLVPAFFDRRPGAVVRQDGLLVRAAGLKMSLVKWVDVEAISPVALKPPLTVFGLRMNPESSYRKHAYKNFCVTTVTGRELRILPPNRDFPLEEVQSEAAVRLKAATDAKES
jgi:hypothetical protein